LSYTDPEGLLLAATTGWAMGLSMEESVAISEMSNATLAVGVGVPAAAAVGTGVVAATPAAVSATGSAVVRAATHPSTWAIWMRIIGTAIGKPTQPVLPTPPTPVVPPAIIRPVTQIRPPTPPGAPIVGGGIVGAGGIRGGDPCWWW